MVFVNGRKIEVTYLDTLQSIKNRIALQESTILKFLVFPPNITKADFSEEDKDITVVNILAILADPKYTLNFTDMYIEYGAILDKLSSNPIQDIVIPYLSLNKPLTDSKEDRDHLLCVLSTQLKSSGLIDDNTNLIKLYEDNVAEFVTNLRIQLDELREEVDRYTQIIDTFKKIGPQPGDEPIIMTPFELKKVTFDISIRTDNLTLIEIFNQIRLSPSIPFATINNIYKILKSFLPGEDWSLSIPDAIILMGLEIDTENPQLKDYTRIAVLQEEQNVTTIGIMLTQSKQSIGKEILTNQLMFSLGLPHENITAIDDNYVNGVFYIPHRSINKYVLSDLIMNNIYFKQFMAVAERDKATKNKNSTYIHFEAGHTGNLAVNITEKIAVKNDPSLRGKDIVNMFPIGKSYLKIRISSAENSQAVEDFKTVLVKLLYVYDIEYQKIVDFYREYIPDFGTAVETKYTEPKVFKLKDIAPEVFAIGYPSKCLYKPTIIGDEEASILAEKETQVMTFPIDNSSGIIPRNYICDHPKHKYPGLRDNPLSNRDLVPFLPCCYEDDHSQKTGSKYRHYYLGESLKTKDIEHQDIIVSNKFVNPDGYGVLPDDINRLFEIVDYQKGIKYVRKGVTKSKSSFLECVMEALDDDTNILQLNGSDRTTFLEQTRQKLARIKFATSGKQEMYDFSIEEIRVFLRDPDIYLDPSLAVTVLENFFNCNIFIFKRIGVNGELILPRHVQTLYKYSRPNTRSIFIYEHMGSTSDHTEYPRCELIVKWQITSESEQDYYAEYNSTIATGVRNIYDRLAETYSLDAINRNIDFPLQTDEQFTLISQTFDSYGKTRIIEFEWEKTNGLMLTSPLPPLILPEIKLNDRNKLLLPHDKILSLIERLDIDVSGINISTDKVIGMIGNVSIEIPVENVSKLQSLIMPLVSNSRYSFPILDTKRSEIKQYTYYKKTARYVLNYTIWFYSKYLHDNSLPPSIETLKRFVDEKTKIDPNWDYGIILRTISLESPVFDGEKIVFKTIETLKRIIYSLRLYTERQLEKLLTYHTRKTLENYYVDVDDFDIHQHQVILQGEDTVHNWICEQKSNYELSDHIIPEKDISYFFQNSLVSPNVMLCQNTDSHQKAIAICNIWNKTGINVGKDPPPESLPLDSNLPKTNIYSYVDPSNITLYTYDGYEIDSVERPIILGYRIDGIPKYSSLLKI